jgi:hypothetical protein
VTHRRGGNRFGVCIRAGLRVIRTGLVHLTGIYDTARRRGCPPPDGRLPRMIRGSTLGNCPPPYGRDRRTGGNNQTVEDLMRIVAAVAPAETDAVIIALGDAGISRERIEIVTV